MIVKNTIVKVSSLCCKVVTMSEDSHLLVYTTSNYHMWVRPTKAKIVCLP